MSSPMRCSAGSTRVEDFEWSVWMATVEKALIDCLVNRRWRVYEDPAIVGTALELK